MIQIYFQTEIQHMVLLVLTKLVYLLKQQDREIGSVKDLFSQFDRFGQGFLQSFLYSAFITVSSVALILLCTSMAAWYISMLNCPTKRGNHIFHNDATNITERNDNFSIY